MSAVAQQGNAPALRFKQEIEVIRPQISAVLPKHIDADRFIKGVLVAVSNNPYLLECNRHSLFAAAIKAAEVGLVLNSVLGEAWLIPFGGQIQMIAGYRGLISLARRSGEVGAIDANVVYEGEPWEYEIGTAPKFRHVPNVDAVEQGKPRFAYAYAFLKGEPTPQIRVVERWKIEQIKKNSLSKITNASRRNSSPWVTAEMEMWRKTAVRSLFKYLPVSTDRLARAMELDDEASKERGEWTDIPGEVLPADGGDEAAETYAQSQATEIKERLKREKAGKAEAPVNLDSEPQA